MTLSPIDQTKQVAPVMVGIETVLPSLPSLDHADKAQETATDKASIKAKEVLREVQSEGSLDGTGKKVDFEDQAGFLGWAAKKAGSVAQNTTGYASSMVGNATKYVANFAVGKIVDFQVNANERYQAHQDVLKEMGFGVNGNTDSLDAMVILRDRLQSVLMELFRQKVPSFGGETGTYLFDQRQKEINDLVGVFVSGMLTNLVKSSGSDQIGDVINYFISFNRSLISHNQLREIKNIQSNAVLSQQQKESESAKIVQKAAVEFLKLGLPNGASDLPLSKKAGEWAWSYLISGFSAILQEWNRLFVEPARFPRTHGRAFEFNQFEQSAEVTSIIQALTKQAPLLAAKLFTEDTKNRVAGKAAKLISAEYRVRDWLQPFLKKQLSSIISPDQIEMWRFVSDSLEGTISHVFGALAVNHLDAHEWMFGGKETENFLAVLVEALFKEGVNLAKSIDFKEFERVDRLPEGDLKKASIREFLQPISKLGVESFRLHELPYYKLLERKNGNLLETEILPQIIFTFYRDLGEAQRQHDTYTQQLTDFIKSQITAYPEGQLDQEATQLVQTLEAGFGETAHLIVTKLRKSFVKELSMTADSVAKKLVQKFHLNFTDETLTALTSALKTGDLAPVTTLIEDRIKVQSNNSDYKLSVADSENISIMIARSRVEANNKKREEQYQQIALRFGLSDMYPASIQAIKEAFDKDSDKLERLVAFHRQVGLSPEEQNDLANIVEGKIIQELNKCLFNNSLGVKERRFLRSAVNQVITSEASGAKEIWNYLEKMIVNGALKEICGLMRSSFVQKAVQTAKEGKGTLLSNAISEWELFLHDNMKEIYPKVEAILRVEEERVLHEKRIEKSITSLFNTEGSFEGVSDSALRRELASELSPVALAQGCQKQIEDLFKGFTTQALAQIFPEGANSVPVPAFVRENVFKAFSEQMNKFAAKSYLESIPWKYAKQQNITDLEEAYGNNHLRWTSHVIKRLIGDFIPHILEVDTLQLAKAVVKGVAKVGEKANIKSLKNLVAQHENSSIQLVDQTLKSLHSNPNTDEAIKAVEELADDELLQLMNNLTQRIQAHEAANSDFLTDFITDLLAIAAKHFKTVNIITDETNRINKKTKKPKQNAQDIRAHVMYHAYDPSKHPIIPEKRHPSVAPPDATESEKKAICMESLIAPLCGKLMTIVGINSADDLPVPQASRQLAYKLLQEKLVPEIVYMLYNDVTNPHTLKTLVLTTLEGVEKNLDNYGKNPSKAEMPKDPDLSAYRQQGILNDACSELFSEGLKFAPLSTAKILSQNAKVRHMIGTTAGNALRGALHNKSLLDLIKPGVKAGIAHPIFNPAQWIKDENGVDVLQPHRIVWIDEDGTRITKPAPEGEDFKFFFPKTPEEKAAKDLLRMQDEMRVDNKLRTKAHVVANKATQVAVKATIKRFWQAIQNLLDRFCSKIPGLMAIKRFLDQIFTFMFDKILKPVLKVLFYPITKLIWLIINRYVKDKVEEFDVVKFLEMETHKNCAAKTMEYMVNKLSEDIAPPFGPIEGEDPLVLSQPHETTPIEEQLV